MNRTRWPEPPTARAVSFIGHQATSPFTGRMVEVRQTDDMEYPTGVPSRTARTLDALR
jgi:hypothetical protein